MALVKMALYGPPVSEIPLYNQYDRIKKISGGPHHHSSSGVYVVRRRRDGMTCVEKSLEPEAVPAGVAEMEIRLLRFMNHTGIVAYVDAFIQRIPTPASSLYTEYVGRDLQSVIDEMYTTNRHFHEGVLWDCLKQLVDVMGCLSYGIPFITRDCEGDVFRNRVPTWESIVHRDIKPANILIPRVEGLPLSNPHFKLVDFGCAIQGEDPNHPHLEREHGDMGFTPPEIPVWGVFTDTFMLGGVLELMCWRDRPHDDPNLPRPGTDGGLRRCRGVGKDSVYSSELNFVIRLAMRHDYHHRPTPERFALEVVQAFRSFDAKTSGRSGAHFGGGPGGMANTIEGMAAQQAMATNNLINSVFHSMGMDRLS